MPFPTMPDPAADRAHEHARRHPDRETLELATAGAARVLGVEHSATKALARAALTMATVDLWHARLARNGYISRLGRKAALSCVPLRIA